MNPQAASHNSNSLANWVNDAPTLAESANRYDQIIEGGRPQTSAAQFTPRLAVRSR